MQEKLDGAKCDGVMEHRSGNCLRSKCVPEANVDQLRHQTLVANAGGMKNALQWLLGAGGRGQHDRSRFRALGNIARDGAHSRPRS